jgi:hypothetical protein
MKKSIKIAQILLITLAIAQEITSSQQNNGLSITLEAGFVTNHLKQMHGVHTTDLDIPDFLDGQITLSQYRAHLPVS